MKLTVEERIIAFEILPKEGDFLTLQALRELREALSLTEEEKKRFGVEIQLQDNGTMDCSWENNGEVDIPLNEMKLELIRLPLREKDGQKQLTDSMVSLYEKFVVSREEEDKKEK